jgi:hypothetical protein
MKVGECVDPAENSILQKISASHVLLSLRRRGAKSIKLHFLHPPPPSKTFHTAKRDNRKATVIFVIGVFVDMVV